MTFSPARSRRCPVVRAMPFDTSNMCAKNRLLPRAALTFVSRTHRAFASEAVQQLALSDAC